MNNKQLLTLLESKNACPDARKWVNGKSAKQAWEKCEQPAWLFWIAGALEYDRKKIVLAACACARLALKFVKEGENRPRICIETTEAWCEGKATIEQVRKARAAYAADAYAAYAAATYAAYAADAAATYAADAADAAATYAADAAATYAARNKMRKDCCAAIRKVISFEELLRLAKEFQAVKPSDRKVK